MTKNHLDICLLGAGLFVLSLVTAVPAWSGDATTQSGGTGVAQGEDGSMSTKQGGNTGPMTGRNEHSGSATGAVRDPSKSEPPHGKHGGSSQLGSGSSQESQMKGHNQSGTRTDSPR
jgi:hypothetical protein